MPGAAAVVVSVDRVREVDAGSNDAKANETTEAQV